MNVLFLKDSFWDCVYLPAIEVTEPKKNVRASILQEYNFQEKILTIYSVLFWHKCDAVIQLLIVKPNY